MQHQVQNAYADLTSFAQTVHTQQQYQPTQPPQPQQQFQMAPTPQYQPQQSTSTAFTASIWIITAEGSQCCHRGPWLWGSTHLGHRQVMTSWDPSACNNNSEWRRRPNINLDNQLQQPVQPPYGSSQQKAVNAATEGHYYEAQLTWDTGNFQVGKLFKIHPWVTTILNGANINLNNQPQQSTSTAFIGLWTSIQHNYLEKL